VRMGVVTGGTPLYVAPERKLGVESSPASRSSSLVERAGGARAGGARAGGARAGRTTPSDGTRPPSPMSPASDVFSLGVCIAEIHGGFSTAMERVAVLSSLKTAAARPAASPVTARAPRGWGHEFKPLLPLTSSPSEALVLQMLSPEPKRRPSLLDVERAADAAALEVSK